MWYAFFISCVSSGATILEYELSPTYFGLDRNIGDASSQCIQGYELYWDSQKSIYFWTIKYFCSRVELETFMRKLCIYETILKSLVTYL